MELSDKTARQIWQEVKANPNRARFGYGRKAALVNIDFQKAYTRTDEFKTAYETDPRQIDYVNQLAAQFRRLTWPVVWTHVAYLDSGEDAGVAAEHQVRLAPRRVR
jgi:maleamate amidohydrolase